MGLNKIQQSTKAEKEVVSATAEPSPAPSQNPGPAQAKTGPTIQSRGLAVQKALERRASLVVFVLILIVGLIWFAGLKLNQSGREAAPASRCPHRHQRPH
jgi:hypothetical protein